MLLSVVKVKILSANYSAEKNIREATGEVIKELNTGNISAHLYSPGLHITFDYVQNFA